MRLNLTRRELLAVLGPGAVCPPPAEGGGPLQSAGAPLETAPARLYGDVMLEKYLTHEVGGLGGQRLCAKC